MTCSLNVSNLPVTSHSSEPAPTAAMAELSALLTRPVSNAAIQMTAIGNLRPAALGRIRPLSVRGYARTIGKSSHRVVYCGLRRPRFTDQSRLAFFKLDEPS